MEVLFDIRLQLFRLKRSVLDVKVELKFARFLRTAIKAGFNRDQPRDGGGRWANEGGVQITTSPGFLTGIPAIDDTSEVLSDTLTRVMQALEYLPDMGPQIYGMLVHTAFGAAVKLQNLPGVGDIERSFSLENSSPRYGLADSIRTDVVLRNIQGDIIAIYDVKTGDAQMSRARADQLREKTRAAPGTPVFELNVVRGVFRKYRQIICGRSAYLARPSMQLNKGST